MVYSPLEWRFIYQYTVELAVETTIGSVIALFYRLKSLRPVVGG